MCEVILRNGQSGEKLIRGKAVKCLIFFFVHNLQTKKRQLVTLMTNRKHVLCALCMGGGGEGNSCLMTVSALCMGGGGGGTVTCGLLNDCQCPLWGGGGDSHLWLDECQCLLYGGGGGGAVTCVCVILF